MPSRGSYAATLLLAACLSGCAPAKRSSPDANVPDTTHLYASEKDAHSSRTVIADQAGAIHLVR